MKNPQLHRVVWHKGMFLSPQHFQSQDRRVDDVLRFRSESLQQFYWGFTELVIDESALEKKQEFAVTQAKGILPDGTPFDFPDVDATPGSIPISFPVSSQEVTVSLAVPGYQPKGLNVAQEGQGSNEVTRYARRRDENVADDTSPADKSEVKFARPNLALLVTRPAGATYETLPIARLKKGEKGPVLAPGFIPPILALRASPYLRQLLRLLIDRMVARHNALWEPRREKGKRWGDLNIGEISSFVFLQTISSWLPPLRHMLAQEAGYHPEPLFVSLLGLAGALCADNTDVSLNDLPGYGDKSYDHNNLTLCFGKLFEALNKLLDRVDEQKCVRVEFRPSSIPSIWLGDIKDKRWLENTQFFLAVTTSMGLENLIRRVKDGEVKVTSADNIELVYNSVLPGLPLRHDPAPPATLPLRATAQYFRFDQAGAHWDYIKRNMGIGIHIPADFPELKYEVLIALP